MQTMVNLNLPPNTKEHCNLYKEPKIFTIHGAAWNCKVNSHRVQFYWEETQINQFKLQWQYANLEKNYFHVGLFIFVELI